MVARFWPGSYTRNIVTQRLSFIDLYLPVLHVMQEDVGVFLFLLREGCKGFVELIEHGGGFFAALQDLDKLFESGIHVIGIDYTRY